MLARIISSMLLLGLFCSIAFAEAPRGAVIRPKKVDARVKGCEVSEPGRYRATVGDLIQLEYTFPVVPSCVPEEIGRESEGDGIRISPLGIRYLIVPNLVGTGSYLFHFEAEQAGNGTATVVIDNVRYVYRFDVEENPKRKELKEKARSERTSREVASSTKKVVGTDPYLGEIRLTAFNFPPRGWVFCEGQTLPINQYQAVYALMGTMYGGNGRTTFGVPDLRGRVAVHAGDGPESGKVMLGEKIGGDMAARTKKFEKGADTRPFLGLRYMMAVQGLFPSRSDNVDRDSGGMVGEIRMFAGTFAPAGWALCNGQQLRVAEYKSLYSEIGNTYGGNETHFALPDLRGRVPVHAGWGAGLAPVRQGEVGSGQLVSMTKDRENAIRTRAGLAIHYIIALNGVTPDPEVYNLASYVGEVRAIAGKTIPGGWSNCDGQLLAIAQNSALFSLVGTTFGGDGRTTFGLPCLRGRTPVHASEDPDGEKILWGQRGGGGRAAIASDSEKAVRTRAFLGIRYIIQNQGIYPSRS